MTRPHDTPLARLARELVDADTVEASVHHIVDFTAETFDVEHTSITLIRNQGRTFESVGARTPAVQEADALQTALGEGPCVDAAAESRTVVSDDLATDPRWPTWGPKVAALGLESALSAELHAGGRRIGALNIYGTRSRVFDRGEQELAQVLAHHGAAALRAAREIEGLTIALDSRTVVGQAQGILMERYRVSNDRAFAILRRYSQDHNIKLITVARDLVSGSTLPVDVVPSDT